MFQDNRLRDLAQLLLNRSDIISPYDGGTNCAVYRTSIAKIQPTNIIRQKRHKKDGEGAEGAYLYLKALLFLRARPGVDPGKKGYFLMKLKTKLTP